MDDARPTITTLSRSWIAVRRRASFRMNEASGITVDDVNDVVTVAADPDYRLRAGQYRHGFRLTQIATGVVTQLFDGQVTVIEGNFR